MSAKTRPPLGAPLEFALIAAGGAGLGALAVWAGFSLQYGLGGSTSQVLGRKLLKQLIWLVPVSMYGGALLQDYYSRLLAPGAIAEKNPGLVLLSVGRIMAHFLGFGFPILFAFMGSLGAHGFKVALNSILRRNEAVGEFKTIPVPLWFWFYPMIILKVENEAEDGEQFKDMQQSMPRARFLKWLPAICAGIMFLTLLRGEDDGEPMSPYWLTAGAAFWLGDYLITALRVMPALRARRGLRP